MKPMKTAQAAPQLVKPKPTENKDDMKTLKSSHVQRKAHTINRKRNPDQEWKVETNSLDISNTEYRVEVNFTIGSGKRRSDLKLCIARDDLFTLQRHIDSCFFKRFKAQANRLKNQDRAMKRLMEENDRLKGLSSNETDNLTSDIVI